MSVRPMLFVEVCTRCGGLNGESARRSARRTLIPGSILVLLTPGSPIYRLFRIQMRSAACTSGLASVYAR